MYPISHVDKTCRSGLATPQLERLALQVNAIPFKPCNLVVPGSGVEKHDDDIVHLVLPISRSAGVWLAGGKVREQGLGERIEAAGADDIRLGTIAAVELQSGLRIIDGNQLAVRIEELAEIAAPFRNGGNAGRGRDALVLVEFIVAEQEECLVM